ncbi:Metallothionein-like protein 4A [Dendrobium catenatum]|uniref:Metallothionein-like protein n=1 Tax=Dendrobium catenatum TaxID=906689 RepID=A0A2I0VXR2_9ASPA|nr:Metallothionein-like protein 4A [Dendrobium catenatum]
MSCCGGNCGCGAACKCGSGCSGCKMYPDFGEETFTSCQTIVVGAAPQKGFISSLLSLSLFCLWGSEQRTEAASAATTAPAIPATASERECRPLTLESVYEAEDLDIEDSAALLESSLRHLSHPLQDGLWQVATGGEVVGRNSTSGCYGHWTQLIFGIHNTELGTEYQAVLSSILLAKKKVPCDIHLNALVINNDLAGHVCKRSNSTPIRTPLQPKSTS